MDLDEQISAATTTGNDLTGLNVDDLAAACNIVGPASSGYISGLSGQFLATCTAGTAGTAASISCYMSIFQAASTLSGGPTTLSHILTTSGFDIDISGNGRNDIEYFEFSYGSGAVAIDALKPLAIILVIASGGADAGDLDVIEFTGSLEILTT